MFMAYQAQFARMSYEMAQILPKSDPTYKEYDKFKEIFGKDGSMVVVGIDNSNIYQLNNFNAWFDLTQDIKKIEVDFKKNGELIKVNGVTEALSVANAYTLKKNYESKKFDFNQIVQKKPSSQGEVDEIKKAIHQQPFYNGFLYNDTTHATLILITLDREVLDSKYRNALFERIDEEVAEFEQQTGIKTYKSGLPYIRANSTTKVADEVELFLLLSVLITSLILYLFFRSFKVMMYSMLVVSIGVVWSLGVLSLFDFEITLLTGLIPPLIIVIGIPNCIFLLNKYHREYKKHNNQIKALSRVIEKTGNAIFLTNTTTALGFATFISTKSAMLVEFGIVAAIDIFLVFILSIFLIPIIFSFLKPPKKRHTKHLENKIMGKVVDFVEVIVLNHRKKVYVVSILILVFSLFGISKMTTTGNLIDDLPKNDPIVEDLKFFEKGFNGVMPFEVMIDTKEKNGVFSDNAKTLYKIQKFQKEMAKYKEFSKPLSIVEAIKFAYQSYKNGKPKFYILPPASELNKLKTFVGNDNEKGNFSSFIDSTNRYTRVSFQMADVGTKEMDEILNEIQPIIDDIFPKEDYDVYTTGTSVTFLKGTGYLIENLFTSLSLAIFLIAILMSILFSSVRMVLVSLIPNFLPLLTTAAIMGYLGVAIKPSTILIFSIAFGISVDDTIHFLSKYRQELKIHRLGIKKAAILALRETGFSMIYTSTILFFGFGVFTVSSFGGTVALGTLVSLTILFAVFADLVLLPSFLLSLDKALTTKAFRKEPLISVLDEEEDIDISKLKVKKNKKLSKEETP
ncbi:MAG: efflux RND transporter permease subunit [Flavobacteriales bacterium]|nr:efflux RND transporter permease subunit [Flavobacteriales bacterium]MCW8914139.1 efflux RND transporter permease subunit [Flavobacteriales bacterium]MCW8937907.1 efflux RND transporter permease subunit [Flavobacteriales bacterium]MCW8940757.1 efflux RND transporter permease subunit [Flavobacteriales bacterium]MCW8990869.1 efflux RND transporter permease subunit [Flavobacteriales bacterium]